MGCGATLVFHNLVYPLLIFPYVFRALRIKKIYDEATNTNASYNNMNIFRSADNGSLLSGHLGTMLKSGTIINSVQSSSAPPSNPQLTGKNRSDSAISVNSNFDPEESIAFGKQLDKRLLCRFAVCWMPFVLLSMTNFLHPKTGPHLLPTFIRTCDHMKEWVGVFVWVSIHLIEIVILILIVYWIRTVAKAFSVKQVLSILSHFLSAKC